MPTRRAAQLEQKSSPVRELSRPRLPSAISELQPSQTVATSTISSVICSAGRSTPSTTSPRALDFTIARRNISWIVHHRRTR